MPMGRTCWAHRHLDDVPLEVHHVWPMGDGGPDRATNRVTLCANAHGAVHHLIDRYRRAGGPDPVPWNTRRRYGRKVRTLAGAGWVALVTQTMPPVFERNPNASLPPVP